MTKTQKLKLQVTKDYLRQPNRSREFNYKRMIIASELFPIMTYSAIARLMNRTHASIINMVKNDIVLSSYSDYNTFKKDYLNSIFVGKLEDDLKDRVLLCENYWQMKQLQEELKKEL